MTALTLFPGRARLVDTACERLVHRLLRGLTAGELTIIEGARVHCFGQPAADGLAATVEVRDPRLWRRVLASGTLGAGEAYVAGDYEADDLTAMIRLFVRNRALMSGLDSGLGSVRRLRHATLDGFTRPARGASRPQTGASGTAPPSRTDRSSSS